MLSMVVFKGRRVTATSNTTKGSKTKDLRVKQEVFFTWIVSNVLQKG